MASKIHSIGIVVPCYNSERYLPDCIASLKALTWPDLHVVLVNDGSSDNTLEVARRCTADDPRFTVVDQENGGVANARSSGYRLMPEVDAILFLDNDDELTPGGLEMLARTLDSDPNLVGAAGGVGKMTVDGEKGVLDNADLLSGRRFIIHAGRLRVASGPGCFGLETLSVWCFFTTPGQVLIRRSALGSDLPFDQGTAPSDDWDLWVRLACQGQFRWDPEITLWKRCDPNSEWHVSPLMKDAESRCRRKWKRLVDSREVGPTQSETIRAGHRLSCLVRLDWAKDHVRTGRIKSSLSSLKQFAKARAMYRDVWG